jgi:Tc toxin complex TcA C-terminal TcB-binding domain/Neuraminidase-like domain/Salmonella virulence plasmid 28.1kDa A protein
MTYKTTTPSTRWIQRPLMVVHIRPAFILQTVVSISDATTRKSVEDKLNAALKNEIKRSIHVANDVLEKLIDTLKINYKAVQNNTVDQLIKQQVVPLLLKNKTLQRIGEHLAKRGDHLDSPTIAVLLRLSTPLAVHPLFITDVRQGKGRELLRLAKLNETLIAKIDRYEKALESWNNADWNRAVTDKVLTLTQKNTLFFSTELSRLTGEHYQLVDTLHKANILVLPDLLRWDKSDWVTHFKAQKITTPSRIAPEVYADQLIKNICSTYPSEFFSLRIVDKRNAETITALWKDLNPLLTNNPNLLEELQEADVDFTDIRITDQQPLLAKLKTFSDLMNTYSHLGFKDVLNDASKKLAQQQTEINRRVDALRIFLENNAAEDLRFLNLLPPAAPSVTNERTAKKTATLDGINWNGIATSDQLYVRNQVLAYQRVLHLSSDFETAMRLLKTGLNSSVAVSNMSYSALMKKTELPETDAYKVHQKAVNRTAQIAHGIQLKKDAISAMEQGRAFQGVSPSFINDLKDIPGYSDLFGSTNFCECEHCRSIYSPAAYFADLMFFIEQNITDKAFKGKKNHPIHLKKRRPDLWKLQLTCANTDTLIPHLELVIEILESYLKHTLGVQDVSQNLLFDNTAIGLPFHRPLEAIRQYLSDWNLKLTDVYALLNVPNTVLLKEQLHVSEEEWTELTAVALDMKWIRFETANHSKMDVVDFLDFTGLSRKDLDEFKKTNTVGSFSIVKVKLSDDIQSVKEEVHGLNSNLLDRMGRFLRLQRKTGYSITELDEILHCSKITEVQKFTVNSLNGVARFKQVQQAFGVSVELMMSMLDHIPTRAMTITGTALSTIARIPTFTNGSTFPILFHHARFNTSNATDTVVDDRLPALLNVLGMNEATLLLLLEHYSSYIHFDNKGNTNITSDHIALLYAHVTLAKINHITVVELSLVMNQLYSPLPNADFRSLATLESLQQTLHQFSKLPFSITELFNLLDTSVSRVSQEQVVQLVSDVQKSGALSFKPNLLSALPNITTNDAATIFTALATAPIPLIVKTGDNYALTAAYTAATDLTAVLSTVLPNTLSAALVARKDELHAAFMAYHFLHLLPNSLSGLVGLSPEKTTIALAFTTVNWSDSTLFQAFHTSIVAGVAQQSSELQSLMNVIDDVNRLGTIFNQLHFETLDYWFVAQYASILGITNLQQLTVDNIVVLHQYKQIAAGTMLINDVQNLLWQYHLRTHQLQTLAPLPVFNIAIETVPVFAKAIRTASQTTFSLATAPVKSAEALVTSPLNDEEIKLLAKQTNLDTILLRSIFLALPLPSNALNGMINVFKLYDCCQTLRIQGHSLTKLLPRDFAGLTTASTMLWNTLQHKYPTAALREKNLSVYNDKLNMLQRDALCDYIIARSTTLKFKDRDELYNYFLIDVEMSGCFRTSRLVAAISSLQLYVYRCLVNLEQSEKDKFSVLSFINSDSINKEWEWRKNYRVWEANRKVFLYPENYMEPDLRDDKTPLFKELEDGLLQRHITLEAAETAYSTYLAGFSEIAQLKIAGAYFDKNESSPEKECYYFFGRTYNDPYQYYFRRYYTQSKLWEPWVKTDLAISAPSISAIVHLGRLYIFWMEIVSMDKSTFVEGNSIFQGVAHKITLQYSHLQENNRWAPAQKKVFLNELIDRVIVNETPKLIEKLISTLKYVSVDGKLTKEALRYYRESKTYLKVFVTAENPTSETLTVHYYRKRKRTHVSTEKNILVVDSNGNAVLDANNKEQYKKADAAVLNESDITLPFIFGGGNPVTFADVNPIEGFQYFKQNLDLLNNELVSMDEVDEKINQVNKPDETTTEDGFYNSSTGVEAIGLLKRIDKDPIHSDISLVLRNYATQKNPLATDDMLIADVKQNGHALSNPINITNTYDVQLINNKLDDTILHVNKDQHWIHKNTDKKNMGSARTALRINTMLAPQLSSVLFTKGIDQFLSLDTQNKNYELHALFYPDDNIELKYIQDVTTGLPYKGSYGQYYRELFFHIPFLIANQLNADGQYKEAKFWYEKIFDPTAQPSPADVTEKDRVWRYQEFRDTKVLKLKEILNDKETIEQYKKDPFNPFAIARLRMSAFQKCIVMKYVDNLIDWADDLFSQDTMESINEATMLYVLAYEILGKRPVSTGKCENADETILTYDLLGPAIKNGSEFLMYIENVYLQMEVEAIVRSTMPATGAISNKYSESMRTSGLGSTNQFRRQAQFEKYSPVSERSTAVSSAGAYFSAYHALPDSGLLRQQSLPAFCVPPNEILLGYWDRLEDRLFKIRNCMNISGEKRSLALFQPPIDPMLLVRAKAAGLSIDDIVNQLNEALPPYRFTYLVEKARQYISTVQNFGSALLSALEKKDGETLILLRSVHEQNILSLTRQIKLKQIEEAGKSLQGLYSSQQNIQNRVDYYGGLIEQGLTVNEVSEQDSKNLAAILRGKASEVAIIATIAHLIPQLGSPFAMKYGGKETGDSANSNVDFLRIIADKVETGSVAAGMIAHNERRAQEWEQQLKLAQEELKQISQQILAAEIRVSITEKDLELHEKQQEQTQEIHDFYKTKFSNLGLYKFMSTQLGKLYRQSYQMAAQLARQAERAYQFERDATDFFIQGDNWDSDKSGLLSGERLLLQLQRLEKAYMEQNYREMEINQSFSLLQINPQALQDLQRNGKCSFGLNELLFDLYYPGQYRRLIKSVRITIPCIAGPYTNIGAKLTLNSSQIRQTPQQNSALVDIPMTMTNSIATSQAQNDAGVFELNFRDERYLPFEGAGAISNWSLDLPSKIRMFNYDSLADVIVHVSYTAKHDGVFETAVENKLFDDMKAYSNVNGLFRMISIRHEFPDTFYQWLNPVAGAPQQSSFTLESKHFPAWLSGYAIDVAQVDVWAKPIKDKTISAQPGLKIATHTVNWAGQGKETGLITAVFNPLQNWSIDAGLVGFNKTELDDLILVVKYKLK